MHAVIYSQATLLAALIVLKVVALKLSMRVGGGRMLGEIIGSVRFVRIERWHEIKQRENQLFFESVRAVILQMS